MNTSRETQRDSDYTPVNCFEHLRASLKEHPALIKSYMPSPNLPLNKLSHPEFDYFPLDFDAPGNSFQGSGFQIQSSLPETNMSFVEEVPHRRTVSAAYSASTDQSSNPEPPQRVQTPMISQFSPTQKASNSTLELSQLQQKSPRESDSKPVKGKAAKKEAIKDEENEKNKGKNALRNAPGLIFGRVKKGCKEFIEGNAEERDETDVERLSYIEKTIESEKRVYLNFEEKSFLVFLGKFSAATKTWKSLKDVCLEDKLNARVFLLCVDKFLGKDEENDFEEWINEDRGSQVKKDIKTKKVWLLKKFQSIFGFLYRKKN